MSRVLDIAAWWLDQAAHHSDRLRVWVLTQRACRVAAPPAPAYCTVIRPDGGAVLFPAADVAAAAHREIP